MRYDSLCEAQQILCRYTARIVVWNTTDTGGNMENLKLGDIVEYKVENKPYILAHRGSRLYSIIHIGTSNRFVAFSTSIGAHIQSIESSSIPACEYKLLKEIGDFLKRVRFDIIDSKNPSSSIYQNDLTKINASNIACMLNASVSVALSFSKQCFLEELYNLLEVVYIDNVTIHVYMLKNPYVRF